MRPAWLEVELGAISHNLRQVKTILPPKVKLCTVVKANGYGHGAQAVARAALNAGAEWLAVATLDEALELRGVGFTGPVLVLSPMIAEGAYTAVINGISQTVFCLDHVRVLSMLAQTCEREAKVHIKIDSGMGRIGITASEAPAFVGEITKMPGIKIEGIYSHFATSDEKDHLYAQKQIAIFSHCVAKIRELRLDCEPIVHMCNSAATVNFPEAHFDMVRVGLITYGLWPSPCVDRILDIRPAMALKCRISQIKTVKSGTAISYGRTYQASGDRVIASLPLGYADGLGRALSNVGYVAIGGKRAPIVGRICMDQCMVDITDIMPVNPEAEVVFFGLDENSLQNMADILQTINYEIVARMGGRLRRVYK